VANLIISAPGPKPDPTVLRDHQRLIDNLLPSTYKDVYFQPADGARPADEDGYYLITGRVDDVA